MVNSVIGGFQKIKKNKSYLDDDEHSYNKKKKKIKRSSSKFDKLDKDHTNTDDNYQEDDYDE